MLFMLFDYNNKNFSFANMSLSNFSSCEHLTFSIDLTKKYVFYYSNFRE